MYCTLEVSGAEHNTWIEWECWLCSKTACRNHWPVGIHRNYANILETGVKTKDKRHSFLDKNSVNERAPFPRAYASLFAYLRGNEHLCFRCIFAFCDLQSIFL